MPRIDPSRQVSMFDSIFRFYHNQNWAKIEFLYEICRKSTKFHVFQINLIIRFVGYIYIYIYIYIEMSVYINIRFLYQNWSKLGRTMGLD